MYGLPKEVDLTFLEKQTLVQVCFGSNQVILNFHENVSISIESSFLCGEGEVAMFTYETPTEAAPALLKFLHADVTTALGEVDGTLTLRFNNGGVLKILDDSKQYESYMIVHGDRTIIV